MADNRDPRSQLAVTDGPIDRCNSDVGAGRVMATRQRLVVVVPGIGGSVLAGQDGAVVWDAGLGGILGLARQPGRLSLDEAPALRPVGLIRSHQLLPGWTVVPGYDGLAAQLGRLTGAVLDDGQPDRPRPNANVLLFPYDFRLPVAVNAERLAGEVLRRLEQLGGGGERRVVVVAHSMGGLIARYWLGPLGGWPLCRALITLGTPHRGAPKALKMLVNGPMRGILPQVTALLRGWPSIGELLPTYAAVWDTAASVARFPGELPLEWLAAAARRGAVVHREIEDAWRQIPRGLPEVDARIGWNHPTPNAMTWQDGRLTVSKEPPDWLKLSGWRADRGDGTVPAFAAMPPEMDGSNPRRVRERHGPLASAGFVPELVDAYERYGPDSITVIRGDDRPAALGLDLECEYLAGEPVQVTATIDGTPAGPATVVSALLRRAGSPAPVARIRLEPDGAGYRATCAPPPGLYDLTVTAAGIPSSDRLRVTESFAVVDP
jgi:hypothetical protein